jgi:TIR domain
MAQVFISYKSDDRPHVQPLVQGLRANGLAVWWDQEISPDAPWEATIERELDEAKAVIVAWSQTSVASEHVKAEARRARHDGKLIQVFLDHCQPPLFFGERQGVSLRDWNGATSDHRFQTVLEATRAVSVGKPPPAGVGYSPRRRRKLWRTILAAAGSPTVAALLVLAANIGGSRDGLCRLWPGLPFCTLPAVAAESAALAAQARSKTIQAVTGAWDRQNGSCASPITISESTDANGATLLKVLGPNGFAGLSQVIAVDNGAVIGRQISTTPSGVKEQWQYSPNGDEMSVTDKDGVITHLVRCIGNAATAPSRTSRTPPA